MEQETVETMTEKDLKIQDLRSENEKLKQENMELRQQVRKWIPCSERLPENSEEIVLIQVSGKPTLFITLEDAQELAIYSETEGWILEQWPEWRRPEVVAWMPLSEAYKKK